MLKKMLLVLGIMMVFFGIIQNKEIYAGTCGCIYNGTARKYDLDTSKNFCASDETPSNCSDGNCVCNSKSTSTIPTNTCTCTGSGTITGNNCQGNTPNALCELRSAQCRCSEYTTLDDATKNGYQEAGGSGNCSFSQAIINGGLKNNCETGFEPQVTRIELNGGGDNVQWQCICKSTETIKSAYNPFCPDGVKINTALGCVPVKMEEFIPWLLTWLFGIAGGIAFLLMSYGFILVATSGGDEKKVQGAKETITSAIVGLLVCIFAIFILRLIAVNILQIPGI